jgi:hypothetical protein
MNHTKNGYPNQHPDVMELLARMTREERSRLLHDAGIVDEKGRLAERYMPPEDVLVQQRRLAAAGRDLRLHFSATSVPMMWYVTLGAGASVAWGETPEEAVDHALEGMREVGVG